MRLSAEQTKNLVRNLSNIGAQFICGQRPIRHHLDDETNDVLHQGHVSLTSGIDSLYEGEPSEVGLSEVAEGYRLLEEGYEEAEKSVLASETILGSDTTGLARMKDALSQMEKQLEIFQPLLKDIKGGESDGGQK